MRSEIEHPIVAPENARIVRPDGTEIPLELRYVKTRIADDGKPVHEWEAISEYLPQTPPDKFMVGVLPPRTSISFTVRRPDE